MRLPFHHLDPKGDHGIRNVFQIRDYGCIAKKFEAVEVPLPIKEPLPVIDISLPKGKHPEDHLFTDLFCTLYLHGAESRLDSGHHIQNDLALQRTGWNEQVSEDLGPWIPPLLQATDERLSGGLERHNLQSISHPNRKIAGHGLLNDRIQIPEPFHIQRGQTHGLPLLNVKGDLDGGGGWSDQRSVELNLPKALTPVEGVDPPVIAPKDPGIVIRAIDGEFSP